MVKPRPDQKTVTIVDEYCSLYRDLFPEVRSYEYFKYLHIGLLSGIKRKIGYLNRLKAWLCVFFTPRLVGYFSFLYTQLN
jgi:hypothetical protein